MFSFGSFGEFAEKSRNVENFCDKRGGERAAYGRGAAGRGAYPREFTTGGKDRTGMRRVSESVEELKEN